MALQSTISECALAVHERYLLQVRHCQQQAERQARLLRDAVHSIVLDADEPPEADLIIGQSAIAAHLRASQATVSRYLRKGRVQVFKVWTLEGHTVYAIRRADLPKLRRRAIRGEALQ